MIIVKDPIARITKRLQVSKETQEKQRMFAEKWIRGDEKSGKIFLVERDAGSPCLHWLLKGRKCRRTECYARGIPPYLDHFEWWIDQNKKPYAIVGHPYHLTIDAMRDMIKTCDELGLQVCVSTHSWYYPGSTLLVNIYNK